MATLQASAPPPTPRPFAPFHPWDRYAFPVFTVIVWAGVLAGFGGDIRRHVSEHEAAYPLIVHVHAVAFVAWLILFSVQVALVRTRRLTLHRKLGFALLGLAALMMVLGPAAGLQVLHTRLGTPHSDPNFIVVQLGDMLTFGLLVTAAALLRRQGATHKRLMLLSLIAISDAAFARWLGPVIGPAVGGLQLGPLMSAFMPQYLCSDILILALGGYDLFTRRRLQPAYLVAAAAMIASEAAITALYVSPASTPVALRLIGG